MFRSPSIDRIKTTSKNQISSITSSSYACGTNGEEIFELLSALDTKGFATRQRYF